MIESLPSEIAICVIITNPDKSIQIALVRSADGSSYRLPRKNLGQNRDQIDWKTAVQCALSEIGNAVKIIKKDPVLATVEWVGNKRCFTYCFEAEASAASSIEDAMNSTKDAVAINGNVMIWADLARLDHQCNDDVKTRTLSINENDKARLQCFLKGRRRLSCA